jgi:hypothetical protein
MPPAKGTFPWCFALFVWCLRLWCSGSMSSRGFCIRTRAACVPACQASVNMTFMAEQSDPAWLLGGALEPGGCNAALLGQGLTVLHTRCRRMTR